MVLSEGPDGMPRAVGLDQLTASLPEKINAGSQHLNIAHATTGRYFVPSGSRQQASALDRACSGVGGNCSQRPRIVSGPGGTLAASRSGVMRLEGDVLLAGQRGQRG